MPLNEPGREDDRAPTAAGRAAGSTAGCCGPTPNPSGTSTRRRRSTSPSSPCRASPSCTPGTPSGCRGSPAPGCCGPGSTPRSRRRCPRTPGGAGACTRDRSREQAAARLPGRTSGIRSWERSLARSRPPPAPRLRRRSPARARPTSAVRPCRRGEAAEATSPGAGCAKSPRKRPPRSRSSRMPPAA